MVSQNIRLKLCSDIRVRYTLSMSQDIKDYNNSLSGGDEKICTVLHEVINQHLPHAENKIWHGHPVWFLEGNPVVGYAKRKAGIVLLFWSGQSFDEEGLENEGSFKAAQKVFTTMDQIDLPDLKRWLKKSEAIQWDYKNIVKRRGVLERLK
ncbi:MAG: hypothetical protein QG639_1111 [Patescibacteria group bacterium]|jgi:hypothetical protein|nr:hypothetical protein [Patescibacteria group bacterium]